MPSGISIQDAFPDDKQHSGASGMSQTDVFDPSAIFSTPYDAFRFDPLITTGPDMPDMSLALNHSESHSPLSPTGTGLDSVHSARSGSQVPNFERRSSSEEKDLASNPSSVTRRKAQNRAAQRAFRERKERHVKDLEAKLSALESSATSLATDNQRLKLALQRAMTENEILRATSTRSSWRRSSFSSGNRRESGAAALTRGLSNASLKGFGATADGEEKENEHEDETAKKDESGSTTKHASSRSGSSSPKPSSEQPKTTGPNGSGNVLPTTRSPSPPPTTSLNAATEPLLSNNALWDYIVEHPLVKTGQVDIADACDRLRRLAKPGRQGPVFLEKQVREAIENSRKGGGDGLL